MTVRFVNHRLGFCVATFALSGVILGLAAHFATIFLPGYHHDFIIFSLIVPSLTILIFLLQIQWAQPQTEIVTLPILTILWLTEASWATDIIGWIQCDSLNGQTIPTAKGRTGFQSYCYEMKVIQAISWAQFCAFIIAFIVFVKLVNQAQRFGNWQIWTAPIQDMPWFGEGAGNMSYAGHGMGYPQSAGMYPQSPGMYYPGPMTQPGNSIIIQPGINGAPPTVTQIP